MLAALCFLIPPLIIILIRCWITPKKEKFYQIVIQFIVNAVIINALALPLSYALFADGKQPVYNLNHVRSFDIKYLAVALAVGVVTLIIEKIIRARSIRKTIKAIIFVVIAAAAFVLVGLVAQPVWEDDNYIPAHGFYEVENNTIETIFLGSSHVRCGISPMELFEEYGISAYDLSTDNQPVMASYYWIEEAYRLHSETLDTVVLDVDMLFLNPEIAYYHKSLDPMRFSMVKMHAVRAYSGDFSDFLTNFFPLLSYHDRWEEITGEDFLKFEKDPRTYMRGYTFSPEQWVDYTPDESVMVSPLLVVDEDEAPAVTDEFAVEYLQMMVSFCEEHEISLVLIALPTGWTSGEHNAVQALADEYGLDFLDFNVEPLYSETGFNMVSDVNRPTEDEIIRSDLHANFYGATKITERLGQYLVEECGNRDVRGDEKYEFMENELEDYNRYVLRIKLGEFEDPVEYLSYLLGEEDYEIFISVKEDAASALTEEQREYFSSIGLEELADLGYRDSYLAVIDDGAVKTEERLAYDEADAEEQTEGLTEEEIEEFNAMRTVTVEGTMENGESYILSSCGWTTDGGAVSSCEINGTERSGNKRGLNIVVYDKNLQRVVEAVVFDTHASAARKPVYVEAALMKDLEDDVAYDELDSAEQTLYDYLMRVDKLLSETE